MTPTPASRNERLPRLCFLGYRHLREFSAPVIAEYRGRAEIELLDATVKDAVALARERVQRGGVDAFISAGANGGLLRQEVRAPVATIQLGGLDILQALIVARRRVPRVGVIVFGQTLPELDAIRDLLKIEVAQRAYRTPEEARRHFADLRAAGYDTIVGGSIVVEMAEAAGLDGLLAYSLTNVRQGFEEAIELARVARMEAERYAQLNGVLHTLEHAVLAVDPFNQVIAANPPMQRILNAGGVPVLGRDLGQLSPELSLRHTLDSGASEWGRVQTIGRRNWIANRTPIRVQGEIAGAAMTLYDADAIHEADNRLRIQLRRQQASARHRFDDLEGRSASFLRAVSTARRFARTESTVLLAGESGTGKELFAQAMHNESPRAGKPFVAVNCAAFPESLLESELFGYEEGAFTGARRGGKRGLFETAHTGTLFLDEIGDMPLALQSRLLRVLQEREITRLGATASIPVDVRVIVATHQPLDRMIHEGRFRRDLYYRINILRLPVPPLRERHEDIALLAGVLLSRCLARHRCGASAARALAPLLPDLQRYAWPGNIRELENIVERIGVTLLQTDAGDAADADADLRHICPEIFDAPAADGSSPATSGPAEPSMAEQVQAAMAAAGGRRHEAARRLGVSRSTLWRWLKSLEPER